MQKKNENIIFYKNRNVTANYHYHQGKNWLSFSSDESLIDPLVYCAFEFRLALERVEFELLADIRGSKFNEYDFKCVTKVRNINRTINDLEVNQLILNRKLRFLNIVLKQAGCKSLPLAIIDLTTLKKH